MKRVMLPVGKNVTLDSGTIITPVAILQSDVMIQPAWRDGVSIDKTRAYLAIDSLLTALEDMPAEEQKYLDLADKHCELLAIMMQLPNMNFPNKKVRRLYMLTYGAVLEAEEYKEPSK